MILNEKQCSRITLNLVSTVIEKPKKFKLFFKNCSATYVTTHFLESSISSYVCSFLQTKDLIF